jgi:hypothetical protein
MIKVTVFTARIRHGVSATAVQVQGDPIMNGVLVLRFTRSQTATTASGTFPLSGPQGTIITPAFQFAEILAKANALPTPFSVTITYDEQFPNAVVKSISFGGALTGLSSPASNAPQMFAMNSADAENDPERAPLQSDISGLIDPELKEIG